MYCFYYKQVKRKKIIMQIRTVSNQFYYQKYQFSKRIDTRYKNIEDGKISELVKALDKDQLSCGLNGYGYRPRIEDGVKLYNQFDKIQNLSLYSRNELEQAISGSEGLLRTETNRKMSENFEKMISKL